jgi:PTS system beta-glucosides-specific IIC component
MAKDFAKIAENVLRNVGGKENVRGLVHCATRLRFTLKDESRADDAKVKTTGGVLGLVKAGGLYQIVIGGGDVDMVYDELGKLGVTLGGSLDVNEDARAAGGGGAKGPVTFKSVLNKMIATISGIMSPVIPVLFAAGILGALYAILNQSLGDTAKNSDTMLILALLKDLGLYSLPVTIGYSSAKRFKVDPVLGIVFGLMLIMPQILSWAPAMGVNPPYTVRHFLGIPMLIMNYTNAVLPPIFIVYGASFLYKYLQKHLPGVIKLFFAPAITLLVFVPLSLLVIGPIFGFVGYGLGAGINAVFGIPVVGAPLMGLLMGALWQVLVVFGVHVAIIPAIFAEMAANAAAIGQTVSAFAVALGVAVLAQFGSVLAVTLKIKNKERKGAAIGATVSAAFGITEPAIYGFNLPNKKPFLFGIAGGAVGGTLTGIFGLKAIMGGQGFLMLTGSTWDGWGSFQLWGLVIALLAGIAVPFLLTTFFYQVPATDLTDEDPEAAAAAAAELAGVNRDKAKKVLAPAKGRLLSLRNSADQAHREAVLGKGAIMFPEGGKIFAPFNGTVEMVFDTKHALGLKSEDGVELLIHVGIDTVKLNGKGFTPQVKVGDKITAGQLILLYDKDLIARNGYSLETQIVVTNTPSHKTVAAAEAGAVTVGAPIIFIE